MCRSGKTHPAKGVSDRFGIGLEVAGQRRIRMVELLAGGNGTIGGADGEIVHITPCPKFVVRFPDT